MDQKMIARYAADFLGGRPRVDRFYNTDSSKQIDILTCTGEGTFQSLSTIGLSQVDLGLRSGGVPLRVELMMAQLVDGDTAGNILASAAFEVMNSGRCAYGTVIQNVVRSYRPEGAMEHVALLTPVFWEKYEPLVTARTCVAWLLAVPISEAERMYLAKYGVDRFDQMLGEQGVDIMDEGRSSAV